MMASYSDSQLLPGIWIHSHMVSVRTLNKVMAKAEPSSQCVALLTHSIDHERRLKLSIKTE